MRGWAEWIEDGQAGGRADGLNYGGAAPSLSLSRSLARSLARR